MESRFRIRVLVALAFAVTVFAPACAVLASPSPAPAPHATFFLNPAGFNFAQPANLTEATSTSQCDKNFFLDQQVSACDGALSADKIVLVWSYAANGCATRSNCASVSGFNVLKSATGPNGPYHLSDHENADPNQTGVTLSETIADNRGTCFEVQPYSGNSTGPASSPYCLPQPLAPMTLSAVGAGTTELVSYPSGPSKSGADFAFCATAGGGPYKNVAKVPGLASGEIVVGFRDNIDTFSSGAASCPGEVDIYEGAASFDLSKLPSKKIVKAELSMLAADGFEDRNVARETVATGESSPACAVIIGLPKAKQWLPSGDTLFPYSDPAQVPEARGQTTADITNIVSDWLDGSRPNYGLIFASGGNPEAKDTRECLTLYRDVRLTISFKN